MRKRFLLILLLLTATAFAVRMVVSIELLNYNHGNNSVTNPEPTTDMCTYMRLAEQIAKGDFKGVFYYQPFYYAVFLPLIKIIFGSSAWAVITMQSLLGALTVYICGLTTARLWSKNSAITAAVLLTFSGVLILYTPFHLIVTLMAFWMALLYYATVMAIERKNWRRWALVGLVFGAAILTRGNVWLFLPGLLYAAIRCQFNHQGHTSHLRLLGILRRLIPAVALIVCTILPQLPFALHNSRTTGKFSGPSTAANNVLALGNTPEAPPGGREAGQGPGPMEYPTSYSLWTTDKKHSVVEHILEWAKEEPGAFIELTFRKMLLFWDYREIPNNIAFEWQGEQSTTLIPFGWSYSWIMMVLGLSGMVCLFSFWRRDLKMAMLFYLIVAYWLSISAFYILARFRAPIMPLLAVAGGIFACYVWEKRKVNFERVYYFCFPVLLAIFCICFFGYDFYRYHLEADIISFVRPFGVNVAVSPTKDMFLDNGPSTFGAWNYVCFRSDMPLRKTFRTGTSKHYKSAEFTMFLSWETPGEGVFLINGQRFKVNSPSKGYGEEKFLIPFPVNGVVKVRLLSANTRIFFYLDFQRNYGRTMLGDLQPPAELVCRLYGSTEPYRDPKKVQEEKPEKIDRDVRHQGQSNLAMN